MRRVIIESPHAADTDDQLQLHAEYLRAAKEDCIAQGDSPYASHGLLTDVLDDRDHEQRATGIAAGLVWGEVADATVVYADLGITEGMQQGIDHATRHGRPIEYRQIGRGWSAPAAAYIDDKWALEADEP